MNIREFEFLSKVAILYIIESSKMTMIIYSMSNKSEIHNLPFPALNAEYGLRRLNMAKKVICEHCSGEIASKDDLVVANLFINMETYHNDCYAQGLKTAKTFFLNNHPINSVGGTMNALYSLLLSAVALYFLEDGMRFLVIIALIPFLLRILSYILYERHLI